MYKFRLEKKNRWKNLKICTSPRFNCWSYRFDKNTYSMEMDFMSWLC